MVWRLIAAVVLVVGVSACAGRTPAPDTGYGTYKVGKPYRIKGKLYRPKEQPNYNKVGYASWYGPGFHGRKTANGETYNMNAMTAAHKTLPMPTLVKVTNLKNRKSVVLRVNDRGPFIDGRIIDVSRKAAIELGFKEKGVTKVRVEFIGRADKNAPRSHVAKAKKAKKQQAKRTSTRSGSAPAKTIAPMSPIPNPILASAPATTPTTTTIGNANAYAPPSARLFVQVGAFIDPKNAISAYSRVSQYSNASIAALPDGDGMVYRVRIGPLSGKDEADMTLASLRSQGHGNARIVRE